MPGSRNRWNPDDCDGDHDFVYEYGADVVDLLDPQPGERVLDVGCGTGHLTAGIAEAVGDDGFVLGLDRSAEMVARAREAYPDLALVRADARAFAAAPFDAVFSNAALHWIPDQDAVAARVADLLRPGGRFVAELEGGREGLREWLGMFGDSLLAPLSGEEREAVVAAVADRLRPDLYDADTATWTADYRRLRFVASLDG